MLYCNYISYIYEQIIDSLLCHTDLKPQHILFLTKTVFDLVLEIHLVIEYLINTYKVLGSVLVSNLYMDVCV